MKKKIFVALISAIILLSSIVTGCQSGIPQALYDQVTAQVKEAQSKLAEAQKASGDLQTQKSAIEKELAAAKTTITDLQKQASALKEQASLIGATPAETATKIVKNYHETHVYSAYDLFICSDMASEVWNMLKAQNISSVIVIGSKDVLISDILQSKHAWVLATVAPGEYLALETTGGYVVKKSENPLYYIGWSFSSPADLKSHNDMVKEYNTRVGIIYEIQNEVKKVAEEHDRSTDPATADKLLAVYNKLVEIRDKMDGELKSIKAQPDSLATRLY